MVLLAILCLLAFAAGWLAYRLAQSKGRNPWIWMTASILFIVPVVILLVLPKRTAAELSQKRAA